MIIILVMIIPIVIPIIIFHALAVIIPDFSGGGIDFIFVFHAAGIKFDLIIIVTVILVQLGLGEGRGGSFDTGMIQSDGLGLIHADVIGRWLAGSGR